MTGSEKKPYLVRVVETFSKTVVIWSDDEQRAKDMAASLCDTEDIDVTRNGFNGREIICDGVASAAEVPDYYQFEGV